MTTGEDSWCTSFTDFGQRQAQQILPHVFLGPLQSAQSLPVLHSLAITHILIFRTPSEANAVRPCFAPATSDKKGVRLSGHFRYHIVEMPDRHGSLLTSADQHTPSPYASCRDFLDQVARTTNAKCLFHDGDVCIDRAPAVLVCYIMERNACGAAEALQFVQSKRPSVRISTSMWNSVLEFEALVRARWTLAVSCQGPRLDDGHKRRLSEICEDADAEGQNVTVTSQRNCRLRVNSERD
ncbi:unnamed protein product [Jaminaea pallidilutea]